MNYIQNVQYGPKDDLPENDPGKFIKGTEFDAEFSEIEDAIESKEDTSNKGVANGYAPLNNDTKVADTFLNDATTAQKGVLETATNSEAVAGALEDKAITPANLEAWGATSAGVVNDLRSFADPNQDQILFWDDSAGLARGLNPGTGLQITGVDLKTLDTEIQHNNLAGYVANEHINHASVSVLAGAGLTGGGPINSDVTIDVGAGSGISAASNVVAVDLSGLAQMNGNELSAGDEVLVNDGGTNKAIRWQDAGIPITTTSAAASPGSSGVNQCYVLTGGTNRNFTLNTGVGIPGNFFILTCTGTGLWQITGTATRVGASGTSALAAQYSVVMLLCIASDQWVVFGDAA